MTALGISTAQLEPVPQLSVGTAAAGKRMKILGQAPRIDLQLGQHPAKFRIRPLVLQGLVHPVNICGPFLARAGIDQIHSKGVLRVCGKEVPMCSEQAPSGLDKASATSSTPQVCTLHVAESTSPRLQYMPQGPLHDVHLGAEGAKIPGRSQAVLLCADSALPFSRCLGIDPTTRWLASWGKSYPARGAKRREPLGASRE